MAEHSDIVRAARLSVEYVERLARTLYRAMARAYRESLLALGVRYGLEQARVVLSPAIRAALAAEARSIAEKATSTFNGLVEAFIDRNHGMAESDLLKALAAYMRERTRKRSPLVLASAVNPAKLDAIVGFYRENGVEPEFDFRGNEGPPSCLVCTELVRTSPHPLELVLAIGFPHPNCSHSWHVSGLSIEDLAAGGVRPGRISLGRGEPGGLLGVTPLMLRHKSEQEAVEEIRRLKVGAGSG